MVNLQVKRNIKLPVDKSHLLRAAQLTLDLEKIALTSELSIVIGNDALLKKLNQKYRQVNTPTDVLSFTSGEVDPETKSVYLGDVVISLPRAQVQAAEGTHPLLDELQLLVVHGILHLLGYDHLEEADKEKMQEVQNKVLNNLGVKLVNIL